VRGRREGTRVEIDEPHLPTPEAFDSVIEQKIVVRRAADGDFAGPLDGEGLDAGCRDKVPAKLGLALHDKPGTGCEPLESE
jgi:hypothetical protein